MAARTNKKSPKAPFKTSRTRKAANFIETKPTRRSKATVRTRAAEPTKKGFVSLPAELRNRIYSLALTEEDTVRIRFRRRRCMAPLNHENHPELSSPCTDQWSEPSLLHVSKIIRGEASAMYYKANEFEMSISMSDLTPACAWLRSIVGRCGTDPFKRFQFYVCKPMWKELHYLRDFAQLFREIDLQHPSPSKSNPAFLSWFWCYGSTWQLERALDEAVKLGQRGRLEGWGEEWLDVEFGLWADEKLNSGHGAFMRRKNNAAKKRRRDQEEFELLDAAIESGLI